MAGVPSVVIWPEERRNRKVAKLIQATVDWMNNHDLPTSFSSSLLSGIWLGANLLK
ncbi:hypothetical protein [Metabacillus sediminilitoris]|nr:hypothetical protein [Metabacillus sediminilitoris]QGQ46980.1 hypothetical protein GMB29_18075 [Metabacillus sediminilitoris]